MAEIECGKGHLYDSEQYAACPYCNNSQKQVFFETPVSAGNRTVPLEGIQPNAAGGFAVGSGGSVTKPLISPEMTPFATEIGKTRPLDMPEEKKVTEQSKTVGFMEEKLGINPVVGWLVCIEGKTKGKDYKLYGHVNTVGRSKKSDVCLDEDKTISEENHARISYSDKNNRFNIIPADGKNLFYVNGDEVLMPTLLSAYDVIDFGETTLIFVPLCGERFVWSSDENNKTINDKNN
jgi:hypothetical protein